MTVVSCSAMSVASASTWASVRTARAELGKLAERGVRVQREGAGPASTAPSRCWLRSTTKILAVTSSEARPFGRGPWRPAPSDRCRGRRTAGSSAVRQSGVRARGALGRAVFVRAAGDRGSLGAVHSGRPSDGFRRVVCLGARREDGGCGGEVGDDVRAGDRERRLGAALVGGEEADEPERFDLVGVLLDVARGRRRRSRRVSATRRPVFRDA